MKTTEDTVMLITGANGGLGVALADDLLSRGRRNVAFHYRSSKDNISAVLEKYDLDPARHLFFAELTDEADIDAMRVKIEDTLGPVSVLVNLAGGSSNGMSWKLTREEFQRVMDMNMTSTFLCSKAFIPAMRSEGEGRIINITSVVGSMGAAGASHYGAAKAAVSGWTRSVALELARNKVTVNAIALGYFDSGIIDHIPDTIREHIVQTIPLKRLGRSGAELGGIVDYLVSSAGSYVTGQTLHINGGLH